MQTPKTLRMLPDATPANTWGLVVGGTLAHEVLGEVPVNDATFIQATTSGQAVTVRVTGDVPGVQADAVLVGVKVTVRAASMGAGSGTLRVEALTDLTDNDDNTVSRQITVPTGAVGPLSVILPAQEKVSGQFARWDLASVWDYVGALSKLKVRLLSEHASNHVRLTHVRVDLLWSEPMTVDNFFTSSPGALGWTALGAAPEVFDRGVLRMQDASAVQGFRYNRAVSALSDYGVASVQMEASGPWTAADGVFAVNAVTVNLGSGGYIQVNLLKDTGVPKVGLLQGPPTTFDPKLIGSYLGTANYAWDTARTPVWVWVLWDPINVNVYVGGDFTTPVIQVARSLVAAGPSGAFLEFGTLSDAPTMASQGDIIVQRFSFRGLKVVPDSRVVLDWQTRRELSSGVGFQTMTLLWHHSSITFDAYKVRFGGGTEGTGFFIPTLDGSSNTENTGTSVPPNTPVRTLITHGDLKRNDVLPEGARELVIYVRHAVTKVWSVYGVDALVVPFQMFQSPPAVSVKDFLVGTDTQIKLSAPREFRVIPVAGVLPGGATQAADMVTPELASQNGSAASLAPGDPGQPTVTGLSGMVPESVGRSLSLRGAASGNNNGLFPVVAFVSQGSVRVANALAVVPDANNGELVWQEQVIPRTSVPYFEPHQDGLPVVPTEVLLDQDPAGILAEAGDASLLFLVVDAYNQSELRILPLVVRQGTPFEDTRGDAGYRFAVPPMTRIKDPSLEEAYLPPWDAVAAQYQRIASSMKELLDPQTAPLEALELMFGEMGLIFPQVAGYPEEALRRLLDNADAIHRTRYTIPGLRFFLGLLIPHASVDISGIPRGLFFFLNAPDLGFPTLAMIQSAGTDLDVCTYLFAPVDFFADLTITITGPTVSGQSGVLASIVDSGTPGEPNVTGLAGMTVASVGRYLTLEGVGSSANRGTVKVLAYNSPTSVRVSGPGMVVPDPRNGAITWQEKEPVVISEEMKELIRSVIRREIPLADDPVSPRVINLVFAT